MERFRVNITIGLDVADPAPMMRARLEDVIEHTINDYTMDEWMEDILDDDEMLFDDDLEDTWSSWEIEDIHVEVTEE